MRTAAALALAFAAACIPPAEPPPPDEPYYPDDGWMTPSEDPIYGCRQDSDCGAQICGRDRACYPASSIRAVSVTWTVGGEVASVVTCESHPHLFIRFTTTTTGPSFGYAPVPCKNGKFSVDKLPIQYTRVELGIDGAASGSSATITGDVAMIDLP